MLTLLALQTTKALLIAMKKAYRLPQGRLLDNAVEEYAIKLLGVRQVRQIQKAMLDPVKREQLTREPRTDGAIDGESHDGTASAKKIASVRASADKNDIKRVRSSSENKATPPHVSFLRDSDTSD